ncbi:hypothetical protein PDE_00671 [Penicillium oxalicum 114-2]|uniref:Cx9C motif-containing protein 4, mitochondrial n=1 Tax=Penicillium oxalicum (strain 114-2 / CGMCC 5302) TaxID=933388 RepID=S7Z5E1_PENO1|nr:hypothetical protein PDE_00671 [Penicillium oxalicum 114-2]
MGNLKQDLSHEPPCHPRACAIQDCLTKNSYNEDKCQAQIDALYECCNAFYQQQGDQASTVSCPKAGLLRLKMKQRAQAAQGNN